VLCKDKHVVQLLGSLLETVWKHSELYRLQKRP